MRITVFILAAALAAPTPAWASESSEPPERKLGWQRAGEVSFVASEGNSESTTLGLKVRAKRVWPLSDWRLDLGFVLAESRPRPGYAIGSLDEFSLVDLEKSRDTERIYGKTRVDRRLSRRFFWFLAADGEQDRPANIEHRATLSGGIGTTWVEREKLLLKTSYGATATDEKLGDREGNTFVGYRAAYELDARFGSGAAFESDVIFDGNADRSQDFRIEAIHSVTVALTPRLALKASVRASYRNEPATRDVTLFTADPNDPSGEPAVSLGAVSVPNEELDTTVSTSLVVAF